MLILFALDRAVAYIYIPEQDAKEISLYSTEWCSYCASVRTYFEAHNIKFKEYDVEQSTVGLLGLWAFRAQGVPVVVVGSEVIHGYNMEEVNSALDRLRPKLVSTAN